MDYPTDFPPGSVAVKKPRAPVLASATRGRTKGKGLMDYPREFSPQARNSVEAERIKAYQDFEKAKAAARWDSDVEALLRQCVLRVLLAFAREACAISKGGSPGWSIDKIDRVCREFWRRI